MSKLQVRPVPCADRIAYARGAGVAFERIRRVTGYLGTIDRFNNAKQSEERDRVKHLAEKIGVML